MTTEAPRSVSPWPEAVDVTGPDRPGADRRATVLLPSPRGPLGPVTARRMRRALAVYAVVWVLGTLPGALGAGPAATAFGLGLVLPGGGFLVGGSFLLAATTLAAFGLSLTVWWFAGPVVLPPLVWLATAGWAASDAAGAPDSSWQRAAVPAVVLVALVAAFVTHRWRWASQVKRGARLNADLDRVRFTISGPPDVRSGLPVAESSAEDLARLRYGLDLALQPVEEFAGFTHLDQYREAALRYQVNALGYGLSMSQFTRTPAFSGYLAEAQRHAVEKILVPHVWRYWARENLWGNLSLRRDPVDNPENIMLTGFHGVMVGMYETLNDDRYSRPGALSYRWSATERYPHEFGSLAERVHRNMAASDYTLFPCEPNWIYTVCNTFGLNTLVSHDRLHGTGYVADVGDRLRDAYEHEFLRPDGRIVGVRARHLGLSWNFWAGSSVQLNTAYWLHAGLPEIAARTWWLLRENSLRLDAGRLAFPRTAVDRLDPGDYTLGRDTFGQIATTMAAREVGDEAYAAAAQATLDEREPVAESAGARRYAEASTLVNCYAVLGRFGRRSGLRDLVAHGVPDAWRTGPRLADAAYPDVLVARAVTDGEALDLVLRPGDGPRRTPLLLDRLVPGREYALEGAVAATVVADASGSALVEVELDDRREVRVRPRPA